ncbi:ssDNA-binding protein [Cupriavidus sp. CuC1]|uniref:ssDNA-binding protein n=1 Tax=Cupriavidus sp. CuC1 TaxID=3373131 RepID=UPI0037D09163
MKVLLKDVRLAFPDLWTAKQFDGAGPFRYSATLLIEPGSANEKAIEAAIAKVAADKFGKKAASLLQSFRGNSNKFCYLDGNLKEYDGFQGMFYLSSHRKQTDGPVLVIDTNKAPLGEASGKPYAGCYVNASVDIYAQEGQYAGIRCGLIGVQFARDGDSFGGASKTDGSEFEDLGAGADAETEDAFA